MAGHLLFNSGSNESSLAPQFKWLDNTFKAYIYPFMSSKSQYSSWDSPFKKEIPWKFLEEEANGIATLLQTFQIG